MMGSVSKLGGTQVRVGVLGDDATRTHPTRNTITIGEVALINELGTRDGHVPARSFIASTFHNNPEELAELAAKVAVDVIERQVPAAEAMNRAGAVAAELMQRTVLDHHIPPENRPSTIAVKGSDHPLVDTGVLVKAISHAVVHETPLDSDNDNYESATIEETV
jgi:hypothetical protein